MIDAPVPAPGESTLLVRVGACGVCGSDLHIVDWELGAERMVARLPVILGHEPAGEVVEVGACVANFKVGDRVALDPFGTGLHAVEQSSSGAVDLRPMVTHRYSISHGLEAFDLLRERRGVKALIIPND